MDRSAKQRFLEQERLQPNYVLERRKSSDLPRLISAIAFMGVLTLAVAVTYLSRRNPKSEIVESPAPRVELMLGR
jgi:hypothetical protein